MVQSMPMCSHTWPSIYGGWSFRTRTISSRFSTLWYRLSNTTPAMYQAAVTSWTSPHLQTLIRATKSSRKNCTSELSYQKPKEFFQVTPKNLKILIYPLLIHCQSAYNSKFIIGDPRISILNNMVFKMGFRGLPQSKLSLAPPYIVNHKFTYNLKEITSPSPKSCFLPHPSFWHFLTRSGKKFVFMAWDLCRR